MWITDFKEAPFYYGEHTNPFPHNEKCRFSSHRYASFHSLQHSPLSELSTSVKVFVEIVDAFVKVVQVIREHPISNHFLLSDTTLQFIPLPASKPPRPLD